ncbi:MAG: hypothetical protein AB8G11_01625 [Saprospiraceae bacterium]
MRLIIFTIIFTIPFSIYGQDACLKKCKNYNTSVNAGKKHLKTNDYSDAVFEFLAAETAARECGCTSDEINDFIRNAINKLEDQKERAESAESEARKSLVKANKATRAAEYQKRKAEQLAKTEKEQRQKIEAEQAKANRLKTLIESIDDDNSAYQFLYDEGIQYFERGDYKNALVYFANAEFLGGENDSVKILIDKCQIGIKANRYFYAGYLDSARVEYFQAMNIYADSTYYYGQINSIDRIYAVFKNQVIGRDLNNVFTLHLNDFLIKGLPSEIGQLSNLKELNLSHNYISNLPIEIGKLGNLRELNIADNSLSKLPIEIGKLRNLRELNLVNNSLSNLPAEIGELTNLIKFDLSFNSLKILPTEIQKLDNLTTLNLSNNINLDFQDAFIKLSTLDSLAVLYLRNNSLTSLPVEIGQLDNLVVLDLRFNSLRSLPAEIKNLTNLKKLYLEPGYFSKREREKIEGWLKESAPDCEIIIW